LIASRDREGAVLKSARSAARGAKRLRDTGKAARRGQVVRVFLRSARAAGRGARRPSNPSVQPRFGGQDLRVP